MNHNYLYKMSTCWNIGGHKDVCYPYLFGGALFFKINILKIKMIVCGNYFLVIWVIPKRATDRRFPENCLNWYMTFLSAVSENCYEEMSLIEALITYYHMSDWKGGIWVCACNINTVIFFTLTDSKTNNPHYQLSLTQNSHFIALIWSQALSHGSVDLGQAHWCT